MKKSFWSSDKIIALSAMMISMFSLFIFIKQTNIIEKQNHLSVMPYLLIESSDNTFDNTFELYVMNYGVGPAIIESVEVKYKGKLYPMTLRKFWRQEVPGMDSLVTSSSFMDKGVAIPAGGERTVFRAGSNKKEYQDFQEILEHFMNSEFNYHIRYRSIYGDRWEVSAFGNMPFELD